MKKSPVKFFRICSFIFLVNLTFLSGCNNTENPKNVNAKPVSSNPGKKTTPSDNLDELMNFAKMPEIPEEVVWVEEEVNGKKKLTAVLNYDAQTEPKILTVLEKYKQAETAEVGVESWFPEELTAQAQLSGVEMLKGTAYGANEFFNIPYGSGRITKIEGTKYFVLELNAD